MCPPGYHLSGFVATHALGHMMYGLCVHDVPVMYMYIYLNFVCHVQMSKYMYKKLRHLFIQKLYFDFFQTFKDSKK